MVSGLISVSTLIAVCHRSIMRVMGGLLRSAGESAAPCSTFQSSALPSSSDDEKMSSSL